MTTTVCPTCGHAIDPTSLTQRILTLLEHSPFPVSPASIRQSTGSSSGTVYQTLRRLSERGVIRRANRGGMAGWEINSTGQNEQPLVGAGIDFANMLPTPEKERASGIMWQAITRLNSAGEYPTAESLIDDLVELGRGERRDLEWALWSMGRSGIVKTRPDGRLEMPENLRNEDG
jgi:hypothetical protein